MQFLSIVLCEPSIVRESLNEKDSRIPGEIPLRYPRDLPYFPILPGTYPQRTPVSANSDGIGMVDPTDHIQ